MVVTGAAGFIASCLVQKLNEEGFTNVVVVDDFSRADKNKNLEGKKIIERVDRMKFFDWLEKNNERVEFIYHLGARTDTTEQSIELFNELNLNYSKKVWQACVAYQIPLIYASSAATYGGGEHGYEDTHALSTSLKPLNPYGESKNDFDIWALAQKEAPFFWAGLKFFNVYGPNEYHKGRMASVILHTWKQIREKGEMKLFRSHRPEYKDGEQMRDFVYVKDVCEVIYWLTHHRKDSGIYNMGSGIARTFLDLARNTFIALDLEPKISFVDTPIDIRETYQYFTEANMAKLRGIGYTTPFHTLEEGIADYVRQYLSSERYY